MPFTVLLLLSAVACSSARPYKNERSGLIDELGRMDSPEAERGRSRRASDVKLPPVYGWRWPLRKVVVTSPFGERDGKFHEGVDLRAKTGTPVLAAQDGRVVYSGSKIAGYGKIVVVRHDNGLFTIYAHNSRLLVKKGAWIKKGQKVALSGSTGRVRGPHLHFEIRKGVLAVDPRRVIRESARTVASVDSGGDRHSH